MPKPDTIEHRWDILYSDYPEVYDEFASVPYDPPVLDVVIREFGLNNKDVVDIGCGSGKSTATIASIARSVVGVEPEGAMLEIARSTLQSCNNVTLQQGDLQAMNVDDASADAVVAVTTVFMPVVESVQAFHREIHRVLRPGGKAICVNIAPGWYAGDMHDIVTDKSPDLLELDEALEGLGYDYRDFDTVQDYGRPEKMISTFGFIFGRAAIDYIKHNQKTKIWWRNRVRFFQT